MRRWDKAQDFHVTAKGITFKVDDEEFGLRKAERNPRGQKLWYIFKVNPKWKSTRGYSVAFTEQDMDAIVSWWVEYWASDNQLEQLSATIKMWRKEFRDSIRNGYKLTVTDNDQPGEWREQWEPVDDDG